jgi:hypothetical protein
VVLLNVPATVRHPIFVSYHPQSIFKDDLNRVRVGVDYRAFGRPPEREMSATKTITGTWSVASITVNSNCRQRAGRPRRPRIRPRTSACRRRFSGLPPRPIGAMQQSYRIARPYRIPLVPTSPALTRSLQLRTAFDSTSTTSFWLASVMPGKSGKAIVVSSLNAAFGKSCDL